MKHTITRDKIAYAIEHPLAQHTGPEENKALILVASTLRNKCWYVVRKNKDDREFDSIEDAIGEYNK